MAFKPYMSGFLFFLVCMIVSIGVMHSANERHNAEKEQAAATAKAIDQATKTAQSAILDSRLGRYEAGALRSSVDQLSTRVAALESVPTTPPVVTYRPTAYCTAQPASDGNGYVLLCKKDVAYSYSE